MMIKLICFVFCTILLRVEAAEFADMLRNCKLLQNQQLDNCLRHVMESIRPRLATGIPELRLPVLDPLTLRTINFKQSAGLININAQFNNVKVKGVSNFTTNYITADPRSLLLKVGLNLPRLLVNGQYTMSGNIFSLDIKGTGPFYSVFERIVVHGVGHIIPDRVNDQLSIQNLKIDFAVGKMRTRLENLFDGQRPVFSDTINHFINENGHEILEEIEPEVARQINDLVSKVMNDAFSQLPVNTIIP